MWVLEIELRSSCLCPKYQPSHLPSLREGFRFACDVMYASVNHTTPHSYVQLLDVASKGIRNQIRLDTHTLPGPLSCISHPQSNPRNRQMHPHPADGLTGDIRLSVGACGCHVTPHADLDRGRTRMLHFRFSGSLSRAAGAIQRGSAFRVCCPAWISSQAILHGNVHTDSLGRSQSAFLPGRQFLGVLVPRGCDWSRSAPLPIPREAQAPQELIS